jgi:hypothetical protein
MEVHERRSRPGLPAEAIEHVLSALVAERQQLRSAGAEAEVLEANRKALTYWHRELAEARRRARPS